MHLVPTENFVYIASYNTLFAVDRASGELVWSFTPDNDWLGASLAASDEMVYFWSGMVLYALDGTDGTIVWSGETAFESGFGLLASLEDNLYLVSGGSTLQALDHESGEEIWSFDTGSTIFDGFCGNYGRLAVSGENIYLGTEDNFFAVNRNTGEQVWRYAIPISSNCLFVEAIETGDDTVYFSRGTDEISTVYALDTQTGEQLWAFTLDLEQSPFTESLAFNNGVIYYIPSYYNEPKGRLYALDGQTGAELWTYETDERDWGGLSLASHKDEIFMGTGETLYRISRETGEYFSYYTEGVDDIGMFWLTVEGDSAYFGSYYGFIYALDLTQIPSISLRPTATPTPETSQSLLVTLPATDSISQARFSPDGNTLALGYVFDGVDFLDAGTWEIRDSIQIKADGTIEEIEYSPDGKLLAIATSRGDDEKNVIELWNMNLMKHIKSLESNAGWVDAISFSPDGKLIASGNETGSFYLWDVGTGERLRTINDATWEAGIHATSVAFSPDGQKIAIAYRGEPQGIEIWDLESESVLLLGEFPDWIYDLEFTPDGKYLAASTENYVKVFEVGSGDLVYDLMPGGGSLPDIAISPDGTLLATGGFDVYDMVQLWDIQTGEIRCTLIGHSEGYIETVDFSPDGKLLVSGASNFGTEGEFIIWKLDQCTH
jgi:WD40 repeat protein